MCTRGCNTGFTCKLCHHGEVDLGKIFLQNYLDNKLILADPVDGATGSLYIPAVDMKLPDIREDFAVSRKYESINPRKGILGTGWICSLESFLQYRGAPAAWSFGRKRTASVFWMCLPICPMCMPGMTAGFCMRMTDRLETIRTYGEPGYLTEERDNEGGCTRYVYDSYHNLKEKSVLVSSAFSWGGDVAAAEDIVTEKEIAVEEDTATKRDTATGRDIAAERDAVTERDIAAERDAVTEKDIAIKENTAAEKSMAGSPVAGKWITERYGYDRYGRLHYKEDANGNRTSYRYGEEHPQKLSPASMYPETETSPEGYEYFYRYDLAGRETRVEAEGTAMEFSYNGLHHVNQVMAN